MASSTGVRTVFRELRCSLNQPKIKDLKITQYILNQYRKHQITEKQHCKVCMFGFFTRTYSWGIKGFDKTPVSCVIGGNTYHYTNEDNI